MKRIKVVFLIIAILFVGIYNSTVWASDTTIETQEDNVVRMENSVQVSLELRDSVTEKVMETGIAGEKIKVIVKTEDTLKYQYHFLIEKVQEETEDQEIPKEVIVEEYLNVEEYEWKPEEDGNYRISVEILNGDERLGEIEREFIVERQKNIDNTLQIQNDEPTETYEMSRIADLKVQNLDVTPSTEVVLGGKISLSATASGGSGTLQYQFYVIRDGREIMIRDYAASGAHVWIPLTPAVYKVGVRVKDSVGNTVTKEISGYEVKATDLEVESLNVSPNAEVIKGKQVMITAVAAKGSGAYSYQFYVVRDGQEIIIRDYGTSGTHLWGPFTPAIYKVGVRVRDTAGNIVTREIDRYEVKASDLEVSSLNVSPKTEVIKGKQVTITAKAAKGSGSYKYQFYVVRNGQEILLRDYGTGGTYVWGPFTPATYKIGVRVKDAAGNTVTKEIDGYEVKASDLEVSSLDVSPKTEVIKGKQVTITAKAAKGSGSYKYQFYVVRNGQEILLRDYGTGGTYVWGPFTPATYKIGVRVKDAAGNTVTKEIDRYEVKASDLEVSSLSVSPKTEVIKGKQVTITAKAAKGSGSYKYQFYVIRDGQEVLLRDYGTSETYVWGPFTPATYKVGVRVKDIAGNIATKEIDNYIVKVPVLQISTFTSSISDKIVVGQTTTLSVKAVDGRSPYQYKFYVVRDGKEILLRDFSNESSYDWKPVTPANYKVCVAVKDADNNVTIKEMDTVVEKYDLKIEKFQVGNNVSALAGQNVYLYTKATGGFGEYRYRYYVVRNGQEIPLRDFGKDNVHIWGPFTPAEYSVCVEVKDSSGNSATQTKKFKIIQSDFKISNFVMSKAGIAHKGDSIRLTANAAGGSGNYEYRFYVIRNNQEIVIRDYGKSNSYTWVPITIADYCVCVDVNDTKNNLVTTQMQKIRIEDTLIKGIDVSAWQGTINWSSVKKSGISFAILRVIEEDMDRMKVDAQFYNNIANATKNGIPVGGYRYGYAMTTKQAQQEAIATVNALKNSGCSVTYPIAYDVEDAQTQGTLSKTQLTEIIKAYRGVIENNGYKFMIYSTPNWLQNKIDMSEFARNDVWVASWFYDGTPYHFHGYTGPGNVTLWQYSSKGSVPGISGNVDMDISYKSY